MTKRGMWITALAATAVVLSVAVWWWMDSRRQTPSPASPTPSVFRVIGEWEGQVAVFLPESDTPEHVYDTPVASLPAEERERLTAGVAVEDEEHLRRFLEDYLS